MAVCVKLSEEELLAARAEATRRQEQNESRGLKGRNKAPNKGAKAIEMHVLGCIGEIAVAKYLDLEEHVFQSRSPDRNSADLPGNIEVKTRPKHHYDLLIQLDDNPEKIFVLVTSESPEEPRLVGWIYGEDAMKAHFVREYVRGRPCYSVPASKLNPVSTLQPREQSEALFAAEESTWWDVECVSSDEDRCMVLDRSMVEWLGYKAGDRLELGTLDASDSFILRRINERRKTVG
jgi:hypothetical protein